MITSKQCQERYGSPELEIGMSLWTVPLDYTLAALPRRIYCNKELIMPLTVAFANLISLGYFAELKTWDGCFNIRKKKGGSTPSLHSWGLAIDVNAGWNQFGKTPTLSSGFVKCFTDAGFDWGGNWSKPDGQHFQLARFPK